MIEEIYTVYAPNDDITFIMKDTFDNAGEHRTTEVIGFYYGEPTEDYTRDRIGALTAEF